MEENNNKLLLTLSFKYNFRKLVVEHLHVSYITYVFHISPDKSVLMREMNMARMQDFQEIDITNIMEKKRDQKTC